MSDETGTALAIHQAAELILQDEWLTSGLEDDAANVLLRWALDLAARIVTSRAQRGEPLDRDSVAEAVAPVRRLTRRVTDLIALVTLVSWRSLRPLWFSRS